MVAYSHLLHRVRTFINRETQEETMRDYNTATIVSHADGSATLMNAYGDVIQTYSRRRDAVRGATRRGLVIG